MAGCPTRTVRGYNNDFGVFEKKLIIYETNLESFIWIVKVVGITALILILFFGFISGDWYGLVPREPVGATVPSIQQAEDCNTGRSGEREICLQLKRIADNLENHTGG